MATIFSSLPTLPRSNYDINPNLDIEKSPSPPPRLSSTNFGQWQTSTRLLASLINDHMLSVTPSNCPESGISQSGVLLRGKQIGSNDVDTLPSIWIGLSEAGLRLNQPMQQVDGTFPEDFVPPLFTIQSQGSEKILQRELHPAILLSHVREHLTESTVNDKLFDTILAELSNSALNQRYWYEWAASRRQPTLQSEVIDWEQTLYTGHPLHPMHRSFFAESPLPQVQPENISSLMVAHISFIRVPGSDVRISGPFRQTMSSLLVRYGIDAYQPGYVIVPCLTQQIAAIRQRFPSVEVVRENALVAQAQSSLRTVTVPFWKFDLKFAMACKIGSALRTISPWTTCLATELSCVLKEILPPNLWLVEDVAALSGSQDDFDQAKHLGCVIRENLDERAMEKNEVLIVSGAFAEIPPNSDKCYAEILFNLVSDEQKLGWFTSYTGMLIDALLQPVVDHGVAFEAHAQNILVRVNRTSGNISGFAVRDLGSIKVHMPTLKKSGYELFSAIEGSFVPSQDEEETWRIIHFCLFENHLNVLIYRMGIPRETAWAMVREKVHNFFSARKASENGARFEKFLFEDEIQLKAFMKMKFSGKSRDYEYVTVPNILRS